MGPRRLAVVNETGWTCYAVGSGSGRRSARRRGHIVNPTQVKCICLKDTSSEPTVLFAELQYDGGFLCMVVSTLQASIVKKRTFLLL